MSIPPVRGRNKGVFGSARAARGMFTGAGEENPMDRNAWNSAAIRGVVALRVYVFHTDMVGVVYNSRYLDWFEIGRSELMRERGLSYAEVEGRGYSLPVTEARFQVRRPARYDDLIQIETRIGAVRSRDVSFCYEIRCAGVLLAAGETSHCVVDQRTGRAVRVPDWMAESMGGEPTATVGKRE